SPSHSRPPSACSSGSIRPGRQRRSIPFKPCDTNKVSMKRTAVAWVSALAVLVVNASVIAQNAPPPAGARVISFKAAIRIALEQNGNVRAAQTSAALGEVGVSEAKGQFLPNLTFSSTGSKNFGRNSDTGAGIVVDQNTKTLSLGVNSGVVVFDGLGNI